MDQLTELKCESCSSKEFTRNGDYLICDYCGSKYYSPQPKQQKAQTQSQPKAQPQTYTPATTAKKRRRLPLVLTIIFVLLFATTCAGILEEDFEDSQRVYIDVNAGEVASTADFDATVGTAVGTWQGKGSYYNPMYVKVPITIKANQDCTILRKCFNMDDDAYPDDALPEELELKSGQTWTGFVYDDWFYSTDRRGGERGLDETHYSNRVRYYNNDKKTSISWDIAVPVGDSVAVDATTVMGAMPNSIIRMNVTYKESFTDTDNPEAVFAAKGTEYDLPVVAELNAQLKDQLSVVAPGSAVVLRGTMSSLQARVENTAVINEVVLRDAALVTP